MTQNDWFTRFFVLIPTLNIKHQEQYSRNDN